MLRLLRITLQRIIKITVAMGPTVKQGGFFVVCDNGVDIIFIGLQITGIAFRYLLWSLFSAALLVIKKYQVIQRVEIDPIKPSMGNSLLVFVRYFDRRLVCMQVRALQYLLLQGLA
jgi:hypothetical protein